MLPFHRPALCWRKLISDYGPAIGLALLLASLCWDAGFFDDDSVISLWGEQAEQHSSLWSYCWKDFVNFIKFQGRFVPVFSFGILPILIRIGDDILLYRLYFSAVYVVAFILLQHGLGSLFRSAAAATLTLTVFVANIQLQNYHDSYTSYFGYLPIATAFIISAVASYNVILASAVSGKRVPLRLWGTHIAWVLVAISTWELAIVIAALTLLQAATLDLPWRRRGYFAVFPLAWGSLFAVINLVLKQHSTNTGTVVAISSPAGMFQAYWVQLVGTFPFSLQDPATFQDTGWPSLKVAALVGTLFCGFLLDRTIRRMRADTRNSSRILLSLGLQAVCLMVVPPALTAITAKYQAELKPGMAYLQVYIQNLGFSIGVITIIVAARRWLIEHRVGFLLVGLVTLTFVIHWNRNRAIIEYRNSFWHGPRELTAEALQALHLSEEAQGIMIDRTYLQRWENPDFAGRLLGRPLPFETGSQLAADFSRLYVNYTGCVPMGGAGFAHAGIILSGRVSPRENVIVVTRPPARAAASRLEYAVIEGDADLKVRTVDIPSSASFTRQLFTIREPDAIKPGTVRLVLSQ